MSNGLQAVKEEGIVPVISLSDIKKAVPLARALMDGGITNLEITLRTEEARSCIEEIKANCPEMTVSAGTVLTKEQADQAICSGADYVVSPGFNQELVEYCTGKGILIVPGCTSASEVDAGMRAGLKVLKYFPAEALGGLAAIELLAGPFKGIQFLPTGGLNMNNIGTYLASKAVIGCGGSYMAKSALIERCAWDEITNNCRRAMDLSLGFRLAHVGFNPYEQSDAGQTATCISRIFRMTVRETSKSIFAGTAVECMKNTYLGTNGHVGIYTNDACRAEAYFLRNHIAVREETKSFDKSGNLKYFYLKEEIGGFAFHVLEP